MESRGHELDSQTYERGLSDDSLDFPEEISEDISSKVILTPTRRKSYTNSFEKQLQVSSNAKGSPININAKNTASNDKRSKYRANMVSFTADSPYFSSYVDKEMNSLVTLTETLNDISARAKTFGKCGALMAEATRRLSQACKLQSNSYIDDGTVDEDLKEKERVAMAERKESVGEEMGYVLSVLGSVSSLLKTFNVCFFILFFKFRSFS